jgi:hypothetical protein
MPWALLLRSSNDGGLVVWSLIGLGAGIYLFFRGFVLLRRRRLILDTPFSKIRSASMGMVELSGLAVGPYTVVAPITGRPCYYHRTLVWEWRRQGKNSKWVKVAGDCMHVPFFLDDNTGRMLIDPRGAELDLHCDFQQEFCDSFFTTKEPAPDNVRTFLGRHGIVTSNKIKVEEYCIKPKNSLFILGTLADNPSMELTPQPVVDPDSDGLLASRGISLNLGGSAILSTMFAARQDNSGELAQQPSPSEARREVILLNSEPSATASANMTQQQRIAAALTKAGVSNPGAWAAAKVGLPVTATVSSEAPSSSGGDAPTQIDGFDPHPPVVLTKGVHDKTFLISWRSQQDVARSLAWKFTLMIWGGPALALLSLYVLLSLTNLL